MMMSGLKNLANIDFSQFGVGGAPADTVNDIKIMPVENSVLGQDPFGNEGTQISGLSGSPTQDAMTFFQDNSFLENLNQ